MLHSLFLMHFSIVYPFQSMILLWFRCNVLQQTIFIFLPISRSNLFPTNYNQALVEDFKCSDYPD